MDRSAVAITASATDTRFNSTAELINLSVVQRPLPQIHSCRRIQFNLLIHGRARATVTPISTPLPGVSWNSQY